MAETWTTQDIAEKSGHRKRLKERFMQSPLRTLPDYEILEMILFNAIYRRDTKQIAKRLLTKFGSLIAVLSADPADLTSIVDVGESVAYQCKLLLDIFSRLHIPHNGKNVNVLSNWHAVVNYCKLTMGFQSKEYFRVLFLNKKNILIADEILETGTVDKVSIHPREIIKKSLYHNATAIILVHNHPSGDAQPSNEDIVITQTIIMALSSLNIAVYDHVIIAQNLHFSFKGNNLI